MTKTNSIEELLKQKGVYIPHTPKTDNSKNNGPRRRRIYESTESPSASKNKVNKNPNNIHQKLEPNDSQIEVKLEPNDSQIEVKLEPKKQSHSKTAAKLTPKLEPRLEPNESQTEAKLELGNALLTIVGLQKRVLLYVYDSCKLGGSKISSPISIINLASGSNSTISATKKAAARLEQKHMLYRFSTKEGRGGWTRYGIYDHVYSELLHYETRAKLESNHIQTEVKLAPKLTPKLEPTSPSSNSSYVSSESENLTNTSGPKGVDKSDLPLEWQEIDFSELIQLGVHFGRTHLKQWFDRNYCSAKEAQESIWHFGYYFANTPKEKRPNHPINYFMGIMSKSKYFSRPDGYLSPEEIALKRRNDDMKKKTENLKQLQEEGFNLAFETWFESLTGKEMTNLTPKQKTFEEKKAKLKERFRDEFFLTIRDNPTVNVATLKLRVFTEQETIRTEQEQWLKLQISDCEEILHNHPLDGDTQEKLVRMKAKLASVREFTDLKAEKGPELTAEQVRAIIDAQFGPA